VGDEGLAKVSDDAAIRVVCQEVLAESPKEVEAFRGGKDTLIGFFVGQAMKATGGKANPGTLNELLKKALSA